MPTKLKILATLSIALSSLIFARGVEAQGILDAESQRERVLDAATQYTLLAATLEHYAVVVHWESQAVVDGSHSIHEYRLFEAFDKPKGLSRYEFKGDRFYPGKKFDTEVADRQFETGGSRYRASGTSMGGDYLPEPIDITGKTEEELVHNGIRRVYPLYFPIAFTYGLDEGSSAGDEIVNYVLSPKKLFHAELKGQNPAGLFYHGERRTVGVNEVTFDAESSMPIERRYYFAGDPKVAKTITPSTARELPLMERNVTKWQKFGEDTYLPIEVEVQSFIPYRKSYHMKLRWWLGEDVPPEVFTKEDVIASYTDESVWDKAYQKFLSELKSNKD